MIDKAISQISNGIDLSEEDAQSAFDEILTGFATETQAIAYLTALHNKGESYSELIASVKAFRKHYSMAFDGVNAVEITGTGGDGLGCFNISTAAAITAAAAGTLIVKTGNRAATSSSGSADVLEALGINLSFPPERGREILSRAGIAFLFNQSYPSVMKRVTSIRHRLYFITLFNKLRWLNTSGTSMELLGVYSCELAASLAKVLLGIGLKRGAVIHGMDGMDEISVCAETLVFEIKNGEIRSYTICPEELGLQRYDHGALSGGSPQKNARIIREVLSGQQGGARRDAVLINAAMTLHIANPELSLRSAIDIGRQAIDSGAALSTLEQFVDCTAEPYW